MAVWASVVSRAQTVLIVGGRIVAGQGQVDVRLSTSTWPMAAPAAGRGHPVGDLGGRWPDLVQGAPGHSMRLPTTRTAAVTTAGRCAGRRTRRGCPSSRDATTGRAGAGTARTAPPRRARRWLPPPSGDRRGTGGSPGWTDGPSAPGRTPSSRPPAGRPGRGDSPPGNRRRPRRRRGPASPSAAHGRRRAGGRADHVGHRMAAALARLGQGRIEGRHQGRRLLGQDRLGQPGGQPDRSTPRTPGRAGPVLADRSSPPSVRRPARP